MFSQKIQLLKAQRAGNSWDHYVSFSLPVASVITYFDFDCLFNHTGPFFISDPITNLRIYGNIQGQPFAEKVLTFC